MLSAMIFIQLLINFIKTIKANNISIFNFYKCFICINHVLFI